MESESNNSWNQAFRQLRPNAQPSAGLSDRVSALAAAADTRKLQGRTPSHGKRFSGGMIALAATVLFAIGAAISGPRIALARTMRAVSLNLLRARGYHSQITFFYHGRKTMSAEVWYRDGNLRSDGDINGSKFTQIQANGAFLNYRRGEDHATIQKDVGASKLAINLKQLQIEMQNDLKSSAATNLGNVTINDRSLQQITVPTSIRLLPFSDATPGRTMLWIDRDEMLPVMEEAQVQENGRWVTVMHSDLDFEHLVSMTVFSIPHRDSVKITDLNAFGAQVGRRFATPIAQATLGKLAVALRDVQINRDGDVFILYTNGSTWSNWNKDVCLASISDDIGTVYAGTAGALEPFMYHQDPRQSRGITAGRLTMQGACIVPSVPRSANTPRPHSLRLSFECPDGPALRHVTFTVPVRLTDSLLPDYWAALKTLSLGGDEKMYKLDRYVGRSMFFENKQDWRGLLQATDEGLREGVKDVNVYVDRANALEGLHRWDDASKALVDARIADTNGFGESTIAAAETQLKAARSRLAPAHAH